MRVKLFRLNLQADKLDLADALQFIANDIKQSGKDYGVIRDADGNKVGSYGVRYE